MFGSNFMVNSLFDIYMVEVEIFQCLNLGNAIGLCADTLLSKGNSNNYSI